MRTCAIVIQALFITLNISMEATNNSGKKSNHLEVPSSNGAGLLSIPEEPSQIASKSPSRQVSPSTTDNLVTVPSVEPSVKSISISLSDPAEPGQQGFHIGATELAALASQVNQTVESTRVSICELNDTSDHSHKRQASPKHNNYTCWNTLIQCVHYCVGIKI